MKLLGVSIAFLLRGFSWLLLMVFSSGFAQSGLNPKIKVLSEEFIFKDADFSQCHAPTLTELDNGVIMSAWFAGPYERHPDVGIYTSIKGSEGWSKPMQVANGIQSDSIRYPCWNPVLTNFEDSTVLFYKVGPSPSQWWGMRMETKDFGAHWSKPEKLPKNILGPIKNKPIKLDNGVILSPSSTESQDGTIWKSHIELSADGGTTWTKSQITSPSDIRVIQPTLIQLTDGTIKALMRSDQDEIMESVSTDMGLTWTKVSPSKVKNPNSGIDAVSLEKGGHLLVYNPTLSGSDWSSGREKLYLAFSKDGATWKKVLELESHESGEFSYPSIIQDSNGLIHISYTYNREKIKYVLLQLY